MSKKSAIICFVVMMAVLSVGFILAFDLLPANTTGDPINTNPITHPEPTNTYTVPTYTEPDPPTDGAYKAQMGISWIPDVPTSYIDNLAFHLYDGVEGTEIIEAIYFPEIFGLEDFVWYDGVYAYAFEEATTIRIDIDGDDDITFISFQPSSITVVSGDGYREFALYRTVEAGSVLIGTFYLQFVPI